MAQFSIGDHVLADFDGKGYEVAHIAHDEVDNEGKWLVQRPAGDTKRLTWRESADLDADGSGVTFKAV